MKILFIGGTGNISAACVRLAVSQGHSVHLLNRGHRALDTYGIENVRSIHADIHDASATSEALGKECFDVIINFIAFKPDDIERDIRLFAGRCRQYIFISSASVYQKPLAQPVVTESTPLKNPFWQYSRDKIACEERCLRAYREEDFPVTIVRPSHTYQYVIPVSLGGWTDFTIIDRMRRGLPVIVHGDGTSLWSLTHAEDFAKGFTGLFGSQQAIGEAFHITSDEILSWDQIYDAVSIAAGAGPANKVHVPSEVIEKLLPGKEGGLIGDKAISVLFDNTKIKRTVPSFRATIPFQEGIGRTLRWFDEKPGRQQVKTETHRLIDTIIGKYQSFLDGLTELDS